MSGFDNQTGSWSQDCCPFDAVAVALAAREMSDGLDAGSSDRADEMPLLPAASAGLLNRPGSCFAATP